MCQRRNAISNRDERWTSASETQRHFRPAISTAVSKRGERRFGGIICSTLITGILSLESETNVTGKDSRDTSGKLQSHQIF
jgi:hypothetical protein